MIAPTISIENCRYEYDLRAIEARRTTAMFQQIYTIARGALGIGARNASITGSERTRWARDPLAHPALAAMNLSELADLPAGALRSCCRE
jgi:hypothetical protein